MRHRRTVRAGRRLSLVVAAAVAVIVSVPVVVSRSGPAPAATFTCGGPADPGWPAGPFEVAFEANTGSLWTTATEGSANWELGMMPGTSPAVAALSGGGFEVAFQAKYGKTSRSISITVMALSVVTYNRTIDAAIGYMRTIRKVAPGEENDFDIFSNESLIAQVGQITQYVRLGAIVIAFIALLAAGVGIMNIMLVSVTERTHEIGIRMAIGARSRDILVQFLIEAIVLSLSGGLIGVLIGFVATYIVHLATEWNTVIAPANVILSFGFAGAVGVFFGYYPARKASSLNPIEALRYE